MDKKKKPQRKLDEQSSLRRLLAEQLQESDEGDDLDMVDALQEVLEEVPQPGGVLAWLGTYDADERMREHARLLLMMGLQSSEVPEEVRQGLAQEATPVLTQAVRDPQVDDEEKLVLGSALIAIGVEIPYDEYRGYFKDFDAAMKLLINKATDHLSDDPADVEQTLLELRVLGQEDDEPPTLQDMERVMQMMVAFGQKDAAASAALACTVAARAAELGLPLDDLAQAMESLAAHPHERAAWYLAELGRLPGLGAAGAKAKELAQRMKAQGITPRAPLLREFSQGYLSMVDGVGSRSVTLFFRTPEGGMDGVVLILNDVVGMKDAWCAFEDSAALEKAIHGGMGDMSYAPCTVALARELVGDAWAIQAPAGKAFPGRFTALRALLGEAPIEPRRRTPNLGAYMLELMVPSEAQVRDSAELVEYGPYGGLWFSSDAAYEFVKANMGTRARRLKKPQMKRFLQAVIPLERQQLLARMAANLEVESLAGRATQPINQTAAQTYLVLKEDVLAWERVPYIRALAEAAVKLIAGNLRIGMKNQREANATERNMDQQMSAMLEELLGGWDAKQ
ncbi:MAG: hypothetical protein WD042_11980 [Phycisphaeraceae bacterium]